MRHILVLFLIAVCCGLALAAEPEVSLLQTLTHVHPRLIANVDTLQLTQERIAGEAGGQQAYVAFYNRGLKLWMEPIPSHTLSGPRGDMLEESRRALDHVTTFALLYRLNGEERWLTRCRLELAAIAAMPDWHPQHFLDTAEMTAAMSFGYDWLYADLTDAERTAVANAIIHLGLEPGLQQYETGAWWTVDRYNWNFVCSGGLAIGALAVAERAPDLAERVLKDAVTAIREPLATLGPDGGWPEGPGYWRYGTRYATLMFSCLNTALGTDFGLSDFEGYKHTGEFSVYQYGPAKRSFNYADSTDEIGQTAQLRWMSRRFLKPLYAWQENHIGAQPVAFDLLWYATDENGSPTAVKLPLDKLFRNVGVAFFRSSWVDPNALFVGFKGGDNGAGHSHLDLGTFVLQADTVDWAIDLGPDNYNLPDYFKKPRRYQYYRTSTEGHNCITFSGQNQNFTARAAVIAFHPDDRPKSSRPFAIVDLSEAYAGSAFQVRRGLAMIDRRAVLVQDEFIAQRPLEYESGFHTAALIHLTGPREAVLDRNERVLHARILEPEDATFEIRSAQRRPPEQTNDGISKLVIHLSRPTEGARVVLVLWPGSTTLPNVEVQPLDEWVRGANLEPVQPAAVP